MAVKIHKLYNGEVNLEFSPTAHRYKVNGEYVQGVTTILGKVVAKDGLIQWAANLACDYIKDNLEGRELLEVLVEARKAHTRKKEAGGDVGSLTHKWIEAHIGGKDLPIPPEAALTIGAFLEWEDQVKPTFLASEQVVYSRRYHYCGTLDAIARIGGRHYMVDFKTAEPRREFKNGKYTGKVRAYPEHFVQIGAYHQAYQEESGGYITDHMVVYITKKGELHQFESFDTEKNKYAFINALKLARRLEELSA